MIIIAVYDSIAVSGNAQWHAACGTVVDVLLMTPLSAWQCAASDKRPVTTVPHDNAKSAGHSRTANLSLCNGIKPAGGYHCDTHPG